MLKFCNVKIVCITTSVTSTMLAEKILRLMHDGRKPKIFQIKIMCVKSDILICVIKLKYFKFCQQYLYVLFLLYTYLTRQNCWIYAQDPSRVEPTRPQNYKTHRNPMLGDVFAKKLFLFSSHLPIPTYRTRHSYCMLRNIGIRNLYLCW